MHYRSTPDTSRETQRRRHVKYFPRRSLLLYHTHTSRRLYSPVSPSPFAVPSRESMSMTREETAHLRHMTEPAYVRAPPGASHHLPHHLYHVSKTPPFFPSPRCYRNWDIGPLDVISGVGELEGRGLGVRTKIGVLGNLLRCCEGGVKVGNIPCEYCAVGDRNRRALPPDPQ